MTREFLTPGGIKLKGVSAEEMRLIDKIAVEARSPNLLQMMENAGRNLAQLTLDFLGKDWKRKNILVFAGKGGNGGGGICAARHLKNRNAGVALFLIDDKKLRDVPLLQKNIYVEAGGRIITEEELKIYKADIILDAIIGYGLNSTPAGNICSLIDYINHNGAEVVSLDIPTGLNATTGEDYGVFVKPSATLTLAYPKNGLNESKCGRLFLGDIGIPQSVFVKAGIDYFNPFDERWVLPIRSADEEQR